MRWGILFWRPGRLFHPLSYPPEADVTADDLRGVPTFSRGNESPLLSHIRTVHPPAGMTHKPGKWTAEVV